MLRLGLRFAIQIDMLRATVDVDRVVVLVRGQVPDMRAFSDVEAVGAFGKDVVQRRRCAVGLDAVVLSLRLLLRFSCRLCWLRWFSLNLFWLLWLSLSLCRLLWLSLRRLLWLDSSLCRLLLNLRLCWLLWVNLSR
jgi:hypothetical protein